MAEAGVVRCDQSKLSAQRVHESSILMGRRRKAMQQQDRQSGGGPHCAVEDTHTVDSHISMLDVGDRKSRHGGASIGDRESFTHMFRLLELIEHGDGEIRGRNATRTVLVRQQMIFADPVASGALAWLERRRRAQ